MTPLNLEVQVNGPLILWRECRPLEQERLEPPCTSPPTQIHTLAHQATPQLCLTLRPHLSWDVWGYSSSGTIRGH